MSTSSDHPEYWHTRGIGSDWNLTCLATGEQQRLMPNISGFVHSREAGERVVMLFGGRARLDFRPSEPNWIQVKVGAVEQHKDVLGRLGAASYACGGMIDADVIAWAVDPEGKPGLQPKGLRAVNELQVKLDQLKAERDDLLRHRVASEAPGWTYQGPHNAGAYISDAVVAGRVRMLMRDDFDHEAVCVLARDRIRDLSREVARQCDLLGSRLPEGDALRILVEVGPIESACRMVIPDGMGFDEATKRVEAAQRAIGAELAGKGLCPFATSTEAR